jgi:hypothetical protein
LACGFISAIPVAEGIVDVAPVAALDRAASKSKLWCGRLSSNFRAARRDLWLRTVFKRDPLRATIKIRTRGLHREITLSG